jgi:hypothetical protein
MDRQLYVLSTFVSYTIEHKELLETRRVGQAAEESISDVQPLKRGVWLGTYCI